uniref:Protein spinster homolog 1 n=1 Tax=Cacopsylla melanoneura TaxID=428564 RepID=A0A8D8PNV6_9HEMI
MVPIMEKFRSLYNGYALTILTLGYLASELGHFLIGVTSKATAVELEYGDIRCQLRDNYTDHHFNISLYNACTDAAMNESLCRNLMMDDGAQYCEYGRNGLGFEYQILAGPVFILVYTVFGVILGVAADKFNRARLLSISVFIAAAAVVLMGGSQSYFQLVLFRILQAIGEAGCNPLATGILSDLFTEKQRGLVMSIFNWGIYAGIGISFPVGRYITAANFWNLGWRVAYYGSGIFGLIIAFLCATTIFEPKRTTIGEEVEQAKENQADKEKQVAAPEEETPAAWKVMLEPRLIMLCIAASIRHTAGLCFAYNADLFYREIFPNIDLGWGLFFVTFVVGSLGVVIGGMVSDKIVEKMGIKSRVAVLAISQLIATPFAFGSIYMGPVGAMVTLAISYIFAEMWFGILFAILVEIVPLSVRSTTVGVFLFVMNNVGGNLPILVEPLRKATSYKHALAVFYAGAYLVSSILFAATTLMMEPKKNKKPKNAYNLSGVENGAFSNNEKANSNTVRF